MKKQRLIPFWLTPASWGLKGSARAEAEINYYYEGYAREIRLNDVRHEDTNTRALNGIAIKRKYDVIDAYEADLETAKLNGTDINEVHFAHGSITKYELRLSKLKEKYPQYEDAEHPHSSLFFDQSIEIQFEEEIITRREYLTALAEVRYGKDAPEYKIAELTADLEEGIITDTAFEKERATAMGEPWVKIIDQGFDSSEGQNGFQFEFDWNDLWIEELVKSGYTGFSDEEIFEQWFSQVCRAQAALLMNTEDYFEL